MSQRKLSDFFKSPQKTTASSESKQTGKDTEESPGPSAPKKPKTCVNKPRGFCETWLSKHDWLYLSDGKMMCNPCVKTKQNNPFVSPGCTNFRSSTLLRHQKTSSHIKALQSLKLSADMARVQKNAEQINENHQNTSVKTRRHVAQLRTVYCMAKSGISARNFPILMRLQQENGCSVVDEFYTKPEVVAEMETVLSEQIQQSLLDEINDSPYFGLMLDETCDITVEKKMCIYVRYIKDGKACTSYLGNKRVTDCTAEGLKTALCQYLEEIGLINDGDYSALMGLGTDGASVMVGCRAGLGVKLKAMNDKMVQVHCVAHRLNLAASQAGKNIAYLQDYHRYIQILYRFFADSQVRYDKLRELQSLLHGEVKQVPEGTTVRWLSIESAVKMIYRHYDAIAMAIEDDKDRTGKAGGLWSFIGTSMFLLVTALLIDVLTCIGILSLTFQKDSVNLSSIRHNVDSATATLITMKDGSETVNAVLQELNNVPADEPVEYKQIKIKHNANMVRQFNSVRTNFIDNLTENLNQRFPQDELNLLECFDKVFNPRKYPDNGVNLMAYGTDQLNTLCEHYAELLDVDRCKGQFLQFKHFVVSHKADYGDFENFIQMLLSEYSDVYPDLVLLASVALVIPVSSAPCERGFSHQTSLKSKLRNRLNPERLDRLLMIRLNGPDTGMDFLSAARAFGIVKNRQK